MKNHPRWVHPLAGKTVGSGLPRHWDLSGRALPRAGTLAISALITADLCSTSANRTYAPNVVRWAPRHGSRAARVTVCETAVTAAW